MRPALDMLCAAAVSAHALSRHGCPAPPRAHCGALMHSASASLRHPLSPCATLSSRVTPPPRAHRNRGPLVLRCQQLGAQDVEQFIKNLVENGQPVVKTTGLGKNSLSAGGKNNAILGAPEGVEANNFDGQRSFDASAFGM